MTGISLITNNTNSWSAYTRQCFYANGRYWAFYLDDGSSYWYFTSSSDNSTWDTPTQAFGASSTPRGYIFFDGTYVHYVYAWQSSSIKYRRGTPDSNGTISWSAAEQAISTTGTWGDYPSVAVDSSGYAYVGYVRYDGANYYPYITKNANTDGTWSDASGYPKALYSTTSDSTWLVRVLPQTSGKMYAMYFRTGATRGAYCTDGSTWTDEAINTSLSANSRFSCSSDGDDIHFVWDYAAGPTYKLYYRKRSSGSWGSETELLDKGGTGYNYYQSLCVDTSSHDAWAFVSNYPNSDSIYYRMYDYSADSWDASWTEVSGLTGNSNSAITSYQNAFSGAVVFFWRDGTDPYDLHQDVLVDPTSGETVNNVYIFYGKFS
jgi:hypothetical protein